jgi:hypothetical protein
MEPPDARSDVPQWHAVGDWFDVCRATSPALASSHRLPPITTAKACSPGTFVKGTTETFGWTA